MRKLIAMLTPLIALLTVALPVQAASFDCAKAGTKVEHMICDKPEISKLDEELAQSYKAVLKDKVEAEAVKQAQRQWMQERNGCEDAGCVKKAYEARLSSLAGAYKSSDVGAANRQSARDNSQNRHQYHFQLTKGKGIQVCEAYLERLNTTEYGSPPYCGRPESDSVKGFIRLNRVPVSANIVSNLYPIVSTYMSLANQKNLDWADMSLQEHLVSQSKGTPATTQDMLDRNSEWAKVWAYNPPIDIDNDGVPDNVEVWYGFVLPGGIGGRKCGDDGYPVTHYGESIRQPQVAFVITGNNDRLDIPQTIKIFGHPSGGYRLSDGTFSTNFRPIGRSIGIFKYQDIYYFDTFFDGWGDFEGKRRTENTQHPYKKIVNSLAVFLRKDGKTKQVCEYLMANNQNSQ